MTTENEMSVEDAMIIHAKTWRKKLDETLQSMKEVQSAPYTPGVCKRQLAISITDLESSIMRLGMVLKDLNTPSPYPNSYDPSNTKVDPTADGLKL
jgi:hypothetical protein